MSDEQDQAEQLDEDAILGDDQLYNGDEDVDLPDDHASGVPFADADVTDESLIDRLAQEEPEPGLDLGEEEQLADGEPEAGP